jgi:hypothetical protein
MASGISTLLPRTPHSGDHEYTPADAALSLAITYARLYDEADEPRGVDISGVGRFEDYLFGFCEGVPKSPTWAARVTGIPSYTIKALAATGRAQEYAPANEEEMAEAVARAGGLRADAFVSPSARFHGLSRTCLGGTVYDYEADEVIADARVTLIPDLCCEGGPVELLTVTTDDLGTFLVTGAADCRYSLLVEKEGYLPKQWGPMSAEDASNLRDFPLFFDYGGPIW